MLTFFSRCAYCNVKYKIIAKAETFLQDQYYIGKMANVTFQNIGKLKTFSYFSFFNVNVFSNTCE